MTRPLYNPYNEEHLRQQQAIVVDVARKMLAGHVGIIEGARRLERIRYTVLGDARDPDFDVFTAIVSETDALPVGEERQNWAADVLVEQDKAIKRAEDAWQEKALATCSALVKRFA